MKIVKDVAVGGTPLSAITGGRGSAQEPRLKNFRQSQQILSPNSPSMRGLISPRQSNQVSGSGISIIPSKILSSAINIGKGNAHLQG
jgi:hypothetical protein